MPVDLTVVLSGPLAQRAVVLSALTRAGMIPEPDQGTRGHPYGLPDDDPSLGWVAVRCGDINEAADLGRRREWVLRLHWPTPACRACAGLGRVNHGTTGQGTCLHCEGKGRTNRPVPPPEQAMAATIADLSARLAALEAR